MKDIKSLYLEAKHSTNPAVISKYTEAIESIINKTPGDYPLLLEYIIKSDFGVKSINCFIEKNGLPLIMYPDIIEQLESCAEVCDDKHIDSLIYHEASDNLHNMYIKSPNAIAMMEFYNDQIDKSYYSEMYYYKFGNDQIPGRKLINVMDEKFHEYCIPDMILTANSINESATDAVLEYIIKRYPNDNMIFEWVDGILNDIEYNGKYKSFIESKSLHPLVESLKLELRQKITESYLTENPDWVLYTENEQLNAIFESIEIIECKLDFPELFSESDMSKLQTTLYDLYGIGECIEYHEDIADSIIPMCPPARSNQYNRDLRPRDINESLLLPNPTRYDGRIPKYLRNRMDLSYGEPDEKIKSPDDEFKRPSATASIDDSKVLDPIVKDPIVIPSNSPLSEPNNDNEDNDKPINASNGVINNYYYNYTNSLNRNVNSYNRNRTNSDDYSNTNNTTDNSIHHNAVNTNDDMEESSTPWSLDIFNNNDLFMEANPQTPPKPESDHPVRDILTDIDRATVKKQQEAKRKVQNVINTGKSAVKPIKRTKLWLDGVLNEWRNLSTEKMKEKMTNPHDRSRLFEAVRTAIIGGSLFKAGILLHPMFLTVAALTKLNKNKKALRLRNEIISEINAEIEIIDEKIKDANFTDRTAKYKLMRYRNELKKRLIRVGGTKTFANMI